MKKLIKTVIFLQLTSCAVPYAIKQNLNSNSNQTTTISCESKIVYIVQKGDTLNSISSKYGVTVNEIAAKNNIKNINEIYQGQRIIISERKDEHGKNI